MFDLEELRKVATCVFLAAEAEVAEDIAGHIMDAADEIERLRANADVRTDAIIAAGQEIERLQSIIADACEVLKHYDLPEHAYHYERVLAGKVPLTVETRTPK